MEQQLSNEDSNGVEELATSESAAETQSIGEVNGEVVNLNQASVSQISAEKVELVQGAAVSISAQDVKASNSAAVFVEANRIELEPNNFVLLVNAGESSLDHSQVGTLLTRTAHLEQSAMGVMVARDIQAGSIRTGILLAGRVDGQIETVLDTPRTVLLGLAVGAAMGMVVLLGNILSRRR